MILLRFVIRFWKRDETLYATIIPKLFGMVRYRWYVVAGKVVTAGRTLISTLSHSLSTPYVINSEF